MRLLFLFLNKSLTLLIKLLNLILYFLERYIIRKLKFIKNSIYLIYFKFNYLKIIKYYKFL